MFNLHFVGCYAMMASLSCNCLPRPLVPHPHPLSLIIFCLYDLVIDRILFFLYLVPHLYHVLCFLLMKNWAKPSTFQKKIILIS